MTCHEVRNPLNSTVANLRSAMLLLETNGAAKEDWQVELQRTIADGVLAGEFCLRVLANMTSLRRLEAGLLQIDAKPVTMGKVMGKVAAIVRPLMQPGVELRVVEQGGANDVFNADEKILVQLMVNLATNAAKHTTAGFVELLARATPKPGAARDCEVELVVADSGPGLSEEAQKRCFDKFSTRACTSAPGTCGPTPAAG